MKKADNFDASKWLVENKITFQSRLTENQVNNLYMVYDEELSDKDKDVYGFSKQNALYYLRKFDNDKVNARQFLKDDKVWNNFIKNLNNVKQMSDKEIEDAMRKEMSMYFFNKPDKLGESQLSEIKKFTYENDFNFKWKSQPANPQSILTDIDSGEEFTKEEFWKSDIIGTNLEDILPDYGGENPDGTWTLDFDADSEISGFVEGEDFTFGDEETNNLNEGIVTAPLSNFLWKLNPKVKEWENISSTKEALSFIKSLTNEELNNLYVWRLGFDIPQSEDEKIKNLLDLIDKKIGESNLKEAEGTDILSFLKLNKQELLSKLTKKFKWDEDDMEMMSEYEIEIGGDADGNEDAEIAGLGEAGLDFSFNPKKVKDTYGDASNFKLVIAGKPIYGISYNM